MRGEGKRVGMEKRYETKGRKSRRNSEPGATARTPGEKRVKGENIPLPKRDRKKKRAGALRSASNYR